MFDWVVIAQRISGLGPEKAATLLSKAAAATKPGGRVVVIDLFRSPSKSNLTECIEVLRLQLETQQGDPRTLQGMEAELRQAGLTNVQFALMSKSRANLGLALATKPVKS
jgi:hypothetical protein